MFFLDTFLNYFRGNIYFFKYLKTFCSTIRHDYSQIMNYELPKNDNLRVKKKTKHDYAHTVGKLRSYKF